MLVTSALCIAGVAAGAVILESLSFDLREIDFVVLLVITWSKTVLLSMVCSLSLFQIVETDVPLTMVGDKLTVTSLGSAVNFELDNKDITFTVISRDAHGHSASRQFDVPITSKWRHCLSLK